MSPSGPNEVAATPAMPNDKQQVEATGCGLYLAGSPAGHNEIVIESNDAMLLEFEKKSPIRVKQLDSTTTTTATATTTTTTTNPSKDQEANQTQPKPDREELIKAAQANNPIEYFEHLKGKSRAVPPFT